MCWINLSVHKQSHCIWSAVKFLYATGGSWSWRWTRPMRSWFVSMEWVREPENAHTLTHIASITPFMVHQTHHYGHIFFMLHPVPERFLRKAQSKRESESERVFSYISGASRQWSSWKPWPRKNQAQWSLISSTSWTLRQLLSMPLVTISSSLFFSTILHFHLLLL